MKEEDRKIGPEIHCTDLKLSRNLSAHVRKSGVEPGAGYFSEGY